MLNYAKTLPQGEVIGRNVSPNFVEDIVNDWKLQPSRISLLNLDYSNIAQYFEGDRTYAQLTELQQGYLESLRYKGDDWTVDSGNYAFEKDAVNGVNVKEQLVGRLIEDNYITEGMVRQLEDQPIPFSEGAPSWNYNYIDASAGVQRPGITGPPKVSQPGVELQPQGEPIGIPVQMDKVGPDPGEVSEYYHISLGPQSWVGT